MQPLDLASVAEVPHGSSSIVEGRRKCDQVANEIVARRNSSAPIMNFLGIVLAGLKGADCCFPGRACWSSLSDVDTGEYLTSLLNILFLELLSSNMKASSGTCPQHTFWTKQMSRKFLVPEQRLGHGQAGTADQTTFEHRSKGLQHEMVA